MNPSALLFDFKPSLNSLHMWPLEKIDTALEGKLRGGGADEENGAFHVCVDGRIFLN
jgi:hypothetical protein